MSSGTPRVSRPKDAMSTGQSSVPDFLGMFLAGPPSSTVEPSSGSCSGLSQEIALPVDPPGAPTGAGVALSFYDRLSKELHTLQRMRGKSSVLASPLTRRHTGRGTPLCPRSLRPRHVLDNVTPHRPELSRTRRVNDAHCVFERRSAQGTLLLGRSDLCRTTLRTISSCTRLGAF